MPRAGAMALGANGARAIGPIGASLLVLAVGGYEPVFWMLAAALLAVSVAVVATRTDVTGARTPTVETSRRLPARDGRRRAWWARSKPSA